MNIDKLIKEATYAKNGPAKEAYRAIKAELLLNNSSKKPKPEGKIVVTKSFTDHENKPFDVEINELDLSIIKKQIETREEQISMYDANSRKDLADMYREQRDILKVLLPKEVTREQIQEAVMTAYPNGFDKKEMSTAIKTIKAMYPVADGKMISEVVKEHIV